jgi:FKBP-type peptidyl-prolyl cis-trans isomerase
MSNTSKKTRAVAFFFAALFLLATVGTGVGVVFSDRNNKKREKETSDALAKLNSDNKQSPTSTNEQTKINDQSNKETKKMQPITPLPEAITQSAKVDKLNSEDLVVGSGELVQPGDTVTAFYHGTLLTDGKVFDSAYERGATATFPLANVIAGWQQGVPGMKVGGQRRLIIPAALAYGERSPSAAIPVNSDLVFVIEVTATSR